MPEQRLMLVTMTSVGVLVRSAGLILGSLIASFACAQGSALPPLQWGSLAAVTAVYGSGVTLSYGQQDFFAEGTDARLGFNVRGGAYASALTLELRADALAYTYDPEPDAGLALVAYGGIGPRAVSAFGVPNSIAYEPGEPDTINTYVLSVAAVGGLETRISTFGLFMEAELGLPAFGLFGSSFQVLPIGYGITAGLSLGVNYYF